MRIESNRDWYILFVRGGRESKIVDAIYKSLKSNQLDHLVNEIKIIEETTSSGKSKNLLSGYIFINCDMREELLRKFYSIPDIISFVNHSKSDLSIMPNKISTLEVNNFLFAIKMKNRPKSSSKFISKNKGIKNNNVPKKISLIKTDDLILIKEGFFKDHRGSVIKIDNQKELITINIDFLGRLTPVSVKFSECEKI